MIRSLCLVLAAGAVLVAQPREFRLRTGLRVILDERSNEAGLRLHLRVGREKVDPMAWHGLSRLLRESGAAGIPRAILERRMAEAGVRLELGADPQGLGWSMESPCAAQEDAFRFLADQVFRPEFSAAPSQSEPLVEAVSFRTALGFPFPEEAAAPRWPDPHLLHRRLVRPEHAVLVIQGGLSLAEARQLVGLHFGTWAPGLEAQSPHSFEAVSIAGGAGVGIPWRGGSMRERAAWIAATCLAETWIKAESDPAIRFEAYAPFGDAGPWLLEQREGKTQRLQQILAAWRQRPISAAELGAAKARWKAQRDSLALHPEERLATQAWTALMGDPGPEVMALGPDDIRRALEARLGH